MADSIIKVIGIGGWGIDIVNSIVDKEIKGVECVAMDTDKLALDKSKAQKKLLVREKTANGLGAGGQPDVGEKAAQEDIEVIKALFPGEQDCIAVIVAGLGGGTGTGAASVVAEIAKENGASTIAIVCKPYEFEGDVRIKFAEEGIKKLCNSVGSIITLKNQGIMTAIDDLNLSGISFEETSKIICNVPDKFVQMLSDLVYDENVKGSMKFIKSIL